MTSDTPDFRFQQLDISWLEDVDLLESACSIYIFCFILLIYLFTSTSYQMS
jgi:hypothetical protein